MFSTKIRTTILAVIASISFAVTAAAPAVSAAQPIDGQGAAGCEYEGATYGTGDRIVVFSGAHYDIYYCGDDGNWHKSEQVVKAPKTPISVTTGKVLAQASAK